MVRSVSAFVIAVIGTVALAHLLGIAPFGDRGPARSGVDVVAGPDEGDPGLKPLPAAVNGVRTLYDGAWLVEEGQWSVEGDESLGGVPSFRRLLESVDGHAVYIATPGFYGRYRTRLELDDVQPAVEPWCEDVAESSLEVTATGLVMSAFETFSDSYALDPGWYRIRYCAEQQDLAAQQDEFTGEEYTTYAGRHLIQLWKSPRQPDRTLRTGSHWARTQAAG